LAREVVVGTVLERQDDVRQPVERDRAADGQPRQPIHLALGGYGDQPFDLFGCVARPLGDDFDQRRREIRISIDRQPVQRARSGSEEHDRHEHH
jgi:hypothetical protein